jgi:hypothetical protein
MKLFIFCIVVLLGLSSVMAQPLHGIYREGTDYMEFDGNKVSFNIVSEGGLVFDLRGAGTYTQTGHFLVINTHAYDGPRSSAQANCEGSSDLVVEVDSKRHLPSITVLFADEKGGFHFGSMLDSTGRLSTPLQEGATALRFSALGMEDFTMDYRAGWAYRISLVSGESIEDVTVILMVGVKDECTLELSVLTMDYKNEQPTEMELNRWERKHNKGYFKSRIRIFQRNGC